MMWRYNQDDTPPVLTARRVSKKWLNATFSSFHGFCLSHSLPAAKPAKYENPKVFIRSDVHAVRAGIKLKGQPPLNNPRVYRQADAASIGGAFSDKVNVGDIIAPSRAFVEEGTSLHYYESIEYAEPDKELTALIAARGGISSYPIVTTDAVYRQTFYKERLWREKGAVGVDMETSAMFSVGKYLGVRVAAILAASDKAPMSEHEPGWKWSMTHDMRKDISALAAGIAMQI